jgi:hypothetical protein
LLWQTGDVWLWCFWSFCEDWKKDEHKKANGIMTPAVGHEHLPSKACRLLLLSLLLLPLLLLLLLLLLLVMWVVCRELRVKALVKSPHLLIETRV